MAIKAIMTLSGLERPSQPYYGALHLFLIKWEKMARSLFEEKTASTVLQTVGEWLRKSIGRGNMVKRMQSPLFPGLPGLLNGIFFSPPTVADSILKEQYVYVYAAAKGDGAAFPINTFNMCPAKWAYFAGDDSAAWILDTSADTEADEPVVI